MCSEIERVGVVMSLPAGKEIDFLIIGAAKCATTWLQLSLSETPEIFMPSPELHFFSREYERGMVWYLKQFEMGENSKLIGEKSNSYLTDPKAAERIAKHFPNVRLIVQLRDPVERAYSDYCMLLRRGEVSRDIDDFLDPDHAADERFLSDGRYGHHLARFYELFPEDAILLLSFEDVRTNSETQLRRVGKHIGFDGILRASIQDEVKSKTKSVVPLSIRKALKPLRPVLDPVRDRWPIRNLRDAIAREFQYPELTKHLERQIAEFYASDLALLQKRNPEIGRNWKSSAI